MRAEDSFGRALDCIGCSRRGVGWGSGRVESLKVLAVVGRGAVEGRAPHGADPAFAFRLRPLRGPKRDHTTGVIAVVRGHDRAVSGTTGPGSR